MWAAWPAHPSGAQAPLHARADSEVLQDRLVVEQRRVVRVLDDVAFHQRLGVLAPASCVRA